MLEKTLLEEEREFIESKKLYKKCRIGQSNIIVTFLKEQKCLPITFLRSCSGPSEYTSRGKLKKFNLEYWRGIDIVISDSIALYISLQAGDIDNLNDTCHGLIDRIGIYVYHDTEFEKFKKKGYKGQMKTYNAIQEMTITDIDLPMNNEKLKKLLNEIQNKIQY